MDGPMNQSLERNPKGTGLKFAAMAGTYLAGVFNDNFFKQCAMLLAISAGKADLQGYATIVFTMPFLLFAAHAGYFADRFPKRSMVICSKILELAAMLLAAFAIYLLNWPFMILALALLGVQATLFYPALNGTIPELYPPRHVPAANSIIKSVTTAAILAGIVAAGFVLDIKGEAWSIPMGRLVVFFAVIIIAALGLIVAFAVPKFPAAAPDARFPWTGPLESIVTLLRLRKDSLLYMSVLASAFFWFIGSLEVLVINQMGIEQFGLSAAMTSTLVLIELAGIAVGSIISAPLAKSNKWYSLLVSASILMAACMFLMASVPYQPHFMRKPAVVIALGVLGMAGGVFLIPVASFIQIRPAHEIKGRVISASNFADFCGILISGAVLYMFNHLRIRPSDCFTVMGVMVTVTTVWLFFALPKKELIDD
jgi:MFS family permease